MKSAEEWCIIYNQFQRQNPKWLEQIQLDARKQGMLDAVEVARNEKQNCLQIEDTRIAINQCIDAILTAANNITFNNNKV